MIIKKEFAMHEFIEEENFLNEMAAEGKCLEKVMDGRYQFSECEPLNQQYKVVYSVSPFDADVYEGFELVTTFTSAKGGYYHYLLMTDPTATLPENTDRYYILDSYLSRIERFNGIIIGSILILFIYLYLTYRNPLYFIIIAVAIGLGGYVFNLRRKIKKIIDE